MPMPKKIHPQLKQELISLQEELHSLATVQKSTASSHDMLGLFRLFTNISLKDWEKLAKQNDFSAWLPISLSKTTYPQLAGFYEHISSISKEKNIFCEHLSFEHLVKQEIERTKRSKGIMSLALLAFQAQEKERASELLRILAKQLSKEKRSYDMVNFMDEEHIFLMLPGAGQVQTRSMLERVQGSFAHAALPNTVQSKKEINFNAGVASFRGAKSMSVKKLLSSARKALETAMQSGRFGIELAPLPEMEIASKETLVLANEKKFLFTGKK